MKALHLTPTFVSRRLPGSFEAQALFAKLKRNSDGGNEQFFERTGGVGIIMTNSLLDIRCEGQVVTVQALRDSAAPILEALGHRLGVRILSRELGEIQFAFPRCDDADEEMRLLAENPFTVLRAIRTILKTEPSHEPFALTLLGVMGFDHVDMFEALPERPLVTQPFPDFEFWLADGLIIVEPDGSARALAVALNSGDESKDHNEHHLALERLRDLVQRCSKPNEALPLAGRVPGNACEPSVDIDDEKFEAIVARLKEHVRAGDIFQAVPSRTFRQQCGDALLAFERLGTSDPSRYRFYFSADWGDLFGASPEPAVRLSSDGVEMQIEVHPIAGTRPRGSNPDQDDRLQAELALDGKEVAEHMMLVDLARNDVARISRPGTRHVPSLMKITKFASVMHLVSKVEGTLALGLDAFDALRSCGIAGTLSGAPKVKAIELIRKYESTARGPYGGVALWINAQGEMDSAIIIRSALVQNGVAQVRAGAGIVHDSVPAAESAETRAKASAVLQAIAEAA